MVWHELGVTWSQAGFGVVSGLGIYVAVVVLTRLFGQRTLARMSSYDFPLVVATGAIIGRIALARTSLLGGLVALLTLFVAQLLVSVIRTHIPPGIVDNRPIALVVDGAIQFDLLGKALMEQKAWIWGCSTTSLEQSGCAVTLLERCRAATGPGAATTDQCG